MSIEQIFFYENLTCIGISKQVLHTKITTSVRNSDISFLCKAVLSQVTQIQSSLQANCSLNPFQKDLLEAIVIEVKARVPSQRLSCPQTDQFADSIIKCFFCANVKSFTRDAVSKEKPMIEGKRRASVEEDIEEDLPTKLFKLLSLEETPSFLHDEQPTEDMDTSASRAPQPTQIPPQ